MPRLAPTPLQLSETEREQLQQLIARHRTPSANCLKSQYYFVGFGGAESPLKSLVNSISVEIWQDYGGIVGWS